MYKRSWESVRQHADGYERRWLKTVRLYRREKAGTRITAFQSNFGSRNIRRCRTGAVDFLSAFAIMYLARQPTGRCKLPDPANQQLHFVSRPIRPKMQGGLLIFQIQNCNHDKYECK